MKNIMKYVNYICAMALILVLGYTSSSRADTVKPFGEKEITSLHAYKYPNTKDCTLVYAKPVGKFPRKLRFGTLKLVEKTVTLSPSIIVKNGCIGETSDQKVVKIIYEAGPKKGIEKFSVKFFYSIGPFDRNNNMINLSSSKHTITVN